MSTTTDDLLYGWKEAERSGDAGRLAAMLTDNFVGIGPVGFMLPKAAWVARLGPELRYDRLDLDEVSERRYDDALVIVARQYAAGEARGNPLPPDTRVTFVAVPDAGGLRIANIQYSFMAPPPGAPGS